jgi:hypothetical protein
MSARKKLVRFIAVYVETPVRITSDSPGFLEVNRSWSRSGSGTTRWVALLESTCVC